MVIYIIYRILPYASVTHPYAPICLHTFPLRIKLSTCKSHVRENVNELTNDKIPVTNQDQERQSGPYPTYYTKWRNK